MRKRLLDLYDLPPPPPLWLEFPAEGTAEPCRWWWHRGTSELRWVHPWKTITLRIPRKDMMHQHGTPEMGGWAYLAREARKRAASKRKRHVRSAVTYGDQGKWHRATVEVEKARLAHDGDADRFYNALLAARLHHAAWSLNRQRPSAEKACALFDRWREGTEVEAPAIHVLLKFELACCAVGRPSLEEKGTQHAVSLGQRRVQAFERFAQLIPEADVEVEEHAPILLDDPAAKAWAKMRSTKTIKKHTACERAIEHHSLLWCCALLQEGGGPSDERALSCLEAIYEDQSKRAAADYEPEALEENDFGGLPPGLATPDQLPRWLITLLYSSALAHAGRGFDARSALEDARALASNDAVDPVKSLEAPPSETRGQGAVAWMGDTRVWITAVDVLLQRRQPFLALRCTQTALETLELSDAKLGSLNKIPKSRTRHRAECGLWWRRAEGLWVAHLDAEAYRALHSALKTSRWHLGARVTARSWEVEVREQGALIRREAYADLDAALRVEADAKLDAQKVEAAETVAKFRTILRSVAVLGEPFDRLAQAHVDIILGHLKTNDLKAIAIAVPGTRRAGCAFLLRAEERALIRGPQAWTRGMLARCLCTRLMREWKAYQAWEKHAFAQLSTTIRMSMAKGPPRYFLGWRRYTREQKKYRAYVATMVCCRVRRILAQRRTARRRKHNRILKADRPRFVRRQLERGLGVLKKTMALIHLRHRSATLLATRIRMYRAKTRLWVEKVIKHHAQRRLKRLHFKWKGYAAYCKELRLASEMVQRCIRSFLSRCHCRNWLARRKRNNDKSNRMKRRLERRDHRIILRAWDKDTKAVILARRIKMASRLCKWYRNWRVYWRAKILRERRKKMRAEQKARTDALGLRCINSLWKNARVIVLQRMWRAYAAKHMLKRLKLQRLRARKLRRKFFKKQGRWVMKAWREMHRRHMKAARIVIKCFRRFVALTCVRRLRKARDMITNKVAFALVNKGMRTCSRIVRAWHVHARQCFAARVTQGRARCYLARKRAEHAQKLRNEERMKVALGVGKREFRTRIKVFQVWKRWAPQSKAANFVVRMCRCRMARDECRELARIKRENDAKIRACIGAKEYRLQKKWYRRCKQIWLWESRSRKIALFVKGTWALRHYREMARLKRAQNAKIRRCVGSKEERTRMRIWLGFKTLFLWKRMREAAQHAVDAADALLAALAANAAYRAMKARAANWLCGRMIMLLARSAAARRRVSDRKLRKKQRKMMDDFRRRQRRFYLSKLVDLIAQRGALQIRHRVVPPKKSFLGGGLFKKKEEKVLVEEEAEDVRPPPKLLRVAPLTIVVARGEGLVAKDWSFKKSNRTSDPYVIVKLNGKEVGKTRVVDKSLAPEWSATFETEVLEDQVTGCELEFTVWDKDLVGSDSMGVVTLPADEFAAEPRWRSVEKTKNCKDASGKVLVGCRVGDIFERPEDAAPVKKKKKKAWFAKKEAAPPKEVNVVAVETEAIVEKPHIQVEDDIVDLPAMPSSTAKAHRSREGLSAQYFEARRRMTKCGVLAWRGDLAPGELVALAAAADAVVLEAPQYGSDDVLLAAAALLAPATPAALTARRASQKRLLARSTPAKLVCSGAARDLVLDKRAGAACGLLTARGGVAAICTHGARCSVGFGTAFARGLVRKDLHPHSLRELALDGAQLGPGALAGVLEAVMLRTVERKARPLARLVLDGNSFCAPTLVGQVKALLGSSACPSNVSLASCRLPGSAAYVLAAGLDDHNSISAKAASPCKLRVTVEKGEGLVVKDWALTKVGRSSDPYVVIKVNGKKMGKTPVVKKSLDPEWGFTLECDVTAPQDADVELNIWDKDLATSDAMGSVSLKDLRRGAAPLLAWHDVQQTADCKDVSGRLKCGAAWSTPERLPTPPQIVERRHLEVLVLRDNPDLGDRGCAAIAAAAARTPSLARLDLARCGCGPQTGFALADELCFQFSVERPSHWTARAPGADVDAPAERLRAPPPDPRPHLSVGLSRNYELGHAAISRLAYVAERAGYRLGVECSHALHGDEVGLQLAGLPAKDRLAVLHKLQVVEAPAPAFAPAPAALPAGSIHKAVWTKADYAIMTL